MHIWKCVTYCVKSYLKDLCSEEVSCVFSLFTGKQVVCSWFKLPYECLWLVGKVQGLQVVTRWKHKL